MSLQSQLDARGDVVITGVNTINTPLIVRARTNLIGNNYASIKTTYDGPAIKTAVDESVTNFSIRSLFLDGGGIEFPAASTAAPGVYPSFFLLDDIFITGASIAFNDSYSGAWMGRISRVFAANGHMGFRCHGGTTKTFDTCHVAGGTAEAWDIFAVHNARFVNCAVDIRDLTVPAATFRACRGLSVDNFYFELNICRGGPLVLFDSCDAMQLSAIYSLKTNLIAPVGGGAYLVQVHSCRGALNGVSLGGGERATPDKATGDPTGHTVPLLLTGLNHLALNGCYIAPALKYVPAQTGFGYLDNSGARSLVALNGCRLDPAFAPGQIDPRAI